MHTVGTPSARRFASSFADTIFEQLQGILM